MEKFDPIPYLRWLKRYPDSTPVLQVGYRPINGGPVQYQDVPTAVRFLSPEDERDQSNGGTP